MSRRLNQLRPNLNLIKLSPDALVARAVAVKAGTTNNPDFPNSPVDPETLGSVIDAYIAAVAAGLDSRKARAQANKLHGDLVRLLRHIAHYVEAHSNNDAAKMLSSGFEPLPPRSASGVAEPLDAAAVVSVRQGNSGQLIVSLKPLRKARKYELQYGPVGGESITSTLPSTRPAPAFAGLTPGTIYAFRVRAFGQAGFTDWSDPVTRMCI